MVLVYLKDGNCIEVRDAITAEVEGGALLCFDSHGKSVASFETSAVEAYTSNPTWAEEIKDKVCQDLTVLTAKDAASQQKP